ncbi:unnamed protein product [Urochloa humidicola]
MLAHGLATDPSRTLRCPVTSRVSTAPLGLVSSLSFNRGRKEKNKIFINVDRYTKYSTPFCYAQRNARIIPQATASFGDMADSSTPIFPRIHVKDPYQRLGISREASEEEIRAARNYLISKKKPKMDLKKKFRELSQSRAVKAVQDGPTLQVAISCAANIYFIYQRVKSGWRAFFYGFGSFFASWFLGTFLMVSVIPPILSGPRNLEVSTACVTYALLFISSTFLK